jgi:hypothetical protein
MTILVKTDNGTSTAINLAKHSWDTENVPGDESRIKMTLDDGREFHIGADKYEQILRALGNTKGFMLLD